MKYNLLFFVLLLAQCEQKPAQQHISQGQKKESALPTVSVIQRLAYPKADSAELVFYKTQYYAANALQKVKEDELKNWGKILEAKYEKKFVQKHYSKYFNLAYRCTEAEANSLEYITNVFFKYVYPLYFRYEPEHPFQIVYFANKPEFTEHTSSDAYGFYQPSTKTLFTYAHSGEGTLWHELMHAFVDANIEHNIPQWFSEGLASFYEMGGIHNNTFVEGYTNWRLPLLQKMLANKTYLPLPAFVAESTMSEDNAYAKARFLFCYLWVYDKMVPFTKTYLYELSARYKGKELGEKAIAEMEKLVGKDIIAIEKEYKIWAMQMLPSQKLQKR